MRTWKLWHHIINPPRDNPVYQWVLRKPGPAIPWYVGCAEVFAFILILPMVAFIGPVYSFGWVIGISEKIARARESGLLALLSITPSGTLGASFALATAIMHREGALARISQRSTWAGRFAVVLLLLYAYLAPRAAAGEPVVGPLITLVILIAAIWPDHVQSLALSCTVGMLAGNFTTSRVNVQWLAFLLLFVFQAGAYGAALSLFLTLSGEDPVRMAGAALAAGTTLFALREAAFVLLWRALENRVGPATVLDLRAAHAV